MTEKMRNTQELLNDLVKDTPTLAKKMHDSRKSNRLICDLIRLRAASGLTQTAMAEKMGCGQSRISKLEHGTDEDITLGELDAYLRALDKHLYMAVFFFRAECQFYDQIPYLRHQEGVGKPDQTCRCG